MTDVAQSSPVTAGYLTALAATGRPIGDAKKPPGQEQLYPYGVLYTGISRVEGSAVNPYEDGLHRLQVTVNGLTRESVDALRDEIRAILLDPSVPIDGHAITWRSAVATPPTARDDDATPPVFYGVEVVNVLVTPV